MNREKELKKVHSELVLSMVIGNLRIDKKNLEKMGLGNIAGSIERSIKYLEELLEER